MVISARLFLENAETVNSIRSQRKQKCPINKYEMGKTFRSRTGRKRKTHYSTYSDRRFRILPYSSTEFNQPNKTSIAG